MRRIIVAVYMAAFMALAPAALAQGTPPAQPAAQAAEQPAGEPPAPGAPATTGAAPQEVSGATGQPAGLHPHIIRAQCEEALRNDAQWRAELKQQLAAEVHQQDASLMLTNKKHVVMAYAALWILVAGFVVFMWLKQQGLKAEIARLESEIRDAAKR